MSSETRPATGTADAATRDAASLAALVQRAAEDVGRLLAAHVTLARLELVAEARAVARRTALVAGAAGLLAVGYACGALALAHVLTRWISSAAAYGALAAGHAVAGLALLASARRRDHAAAPLPETRAELGRTRRSLTSSSEVSP
jgi:hypothetical protein